MKMDVRLRTPQLYVWLTIGCLRIPVDTSTVVFRGFSFAHAWGCPGSSFSACTRHVVQQPTCIPRISVEDQSAFLAP